MTLQASAHMNRREATLKGSIRRVQLDNQKLDASQPVVLASASVAHARSSTAKVLVGDTGPLISFEVIRSFANTMVATGQSSSAVADPSSSNRQSLTAGASVPRRPGWGDGSKIGDKSSAILSFKEIKLDIGEMDFQADNGFLEALMAFVISIPTADIWQDEAWRKQQQRLLTARFGPKEVESLATNAVLSVYESAVNANASPLQWIQEKEEQELSVSCHYSLTIMSCPTPLSVNHTFCTSMAA